MKRYLFILVLSTISFVGVFAQKNHNADQRAVRDEIMSYLKSEGYQPSIDEDGDIKFKRQGDIYFVSVSDKDTNPYYIRLAKYFSYGETVTKANIGRYAEEVNQYKTIKLVDGEKTFWLDSQMFVKSAYAFTSVFNRILQAMDAAESEF